MTEPTPAGRTERRAQHPGHLREADLSTTGELIRRGGLAGGLSILVYLVIGIGFWSLVGFGLDRLFGMHVFVWIGGGVGAVAGLYLVYLHMRPSEDSGDCSA